jgi:hypothetical protein
MGRNIFSRIGRIAIISLAFGTTGALRAHVYAASPEWAYAETHAYDETVARAVALLPKRPPQIVVIDAEKTSPALRRRLERVEAFVVQGKPIVCLRKQGSVLKNAQAAAGLFDYALAAVIWHEMAHIDGADERGAQEQEESLWRRFIVGHPVDVSRALAYSARLRERRDHDGFLRGTKQDSTESAQHSMVSAK